MFTRYFFLGWLFPCEPYRYVLSAYDKHKHISLSFIHSVFRGKRKICLTFSTLVPPSHPSNIDLENYLDRVIRFSQVRFNVYVTLSKFFLIMLIDVMLIKEHPLEESPLFCFFLNQRFLYLRRCRVRNGQTCRSKIRFQ